MPRALERGHLQGWARVWCVGAFAAVASWTISEKHAQGASDQAACPDARVRIDEPVDPSWRSAVDRLCTDFASFRDRDPSATLRVRTAEGVAIVTVSLGDGRVTERRVRAPADLRATIEGLITLPPQAREPSKLPAPETTPRIPHAEPTPAPTQGATKRARESATAIEVGASIVGRVARSPTYVSSGASAYAGVHSESWLLALSIRWIPIETVLQPAPTGFEMDSAGAGFIAARRFAKNPAFDVGATAWVVELTQSYGARSEVSRSHTELHLGVMARALLGSGAWRESVSLDAEVAPGRFRQDTRLDDALPTLPTWSLGLGLGATWEDQ
jgi:hypothetical protein